MRLIRASLGGGISWWWGFGLLICAPALVLALLGLRATRAERIEREDHLRGQRTQFARLADASISTLVGELENDLRRADNNQAGAQPAGALADLPLCSMDRRGLLVFPRERVYVDESGTGLEPNTANPQWPPGVEQLIERAQAAEAQRRTGEAISIYRRIIDTEPKLGDWGKLCVARIRHQSGDAAAKRALVDPSLGNSEAVTPMGLPVALIACAYAEQLPVEARADFIPLIEQTLASLRRGQWWLSYDARVFYDRELRAQLESASAGKRSDDDAHLDELAAITRIVHKSPPSRRDVATRSFERDEHGAFLILWLPSDRNPDVWMGTAVAQHRLRSLLDGDLSSLLSGLPGKASIRDSEGNTIWGSIVGDSPASLPESLRSLPGWEMAFSGAAFTGWIDQRLLLWYGFIALLVVMLVVGLAMTVRVVRREAELARMQNEFVAGVSHEFKSPITGIRLLMERLSGGRLRGPETAGEYQRKIDRELDRLERHVDRLLEAQKLQEGRKEYHFAPASLFEIAQTAINDLRAGAEAKGIALESQAEGDIPPLELDKAAITDAMENLIGNAIKYSPSGSRVVVTVHATDHEVCADVVDQGVGIDPADQRRIFDRFYRGRRGDRHDVHGTGLGLALVKATVEAHGGTIEVTSAPGEGSRFSVRLPVKSGEERGARSN